jgi:hypothetical protein
MPAGSGILDHSAWLLAMIPSFLDATQDHSPTSNPNPVGPVAPGASRQ